jgi:hypothetical protein
MAVTATLLSTSLDNKLRNFKYSPNNMALQTCLLSLRPPRALAPAVFATNEAQGLGNGAPKVKGANRLDSRVAAASAPPFLPHTKPEVWLEAPKSPDLATTHVKLTSRPRPCCSASGFAANVHWRRQIATSLVIFARG